MMHHIGKLRGELLGYYISRAWKHTVMSIIMASFSCTSASISDSSLCLCAFLFWRPVRKIARGLFTAGTAMEPIRAEGRPQRGDICCLLRRRGCTGEPTGTAERAPEGHTFHFGGSRALVPSRWEANCEEEKTRKELIYRANTHTGGVRDTPPDHTQLSGGLCEPPRRKISENTK